jgi:uncharacterized membrane protein (UPF0136 family)
MSRRHCAKAETQANCFLMIPWSILLLYVYGVLLIIGGVMGYVRAKSVPSLVAGVTCGLIALFLGANYTWHFAPHAALVLALALIFLMGRRYLRTGKAMPALPIVGLSVIVALAQLYVLIFVGAGHDPL